MYVGTMETAAPAAVHFFPSLLSHRHIVPLSHTLNRHLHIDRRIKYILYIIYKQENVKYEVCRPTKPHSQDFPPPVWRLGTVKARNEPNGATKSDAHFTRYQILRMHSA